MDVPPYVRVSTGCALHGHLRTGPSLAQRRVPGRALQEPYHRLPTKHSARFLFLGIFGYGFRTIAEIPASRLSGHHRMVESRFLLVDKAKEKYFSTRTDLKPRAMLS
jgi:hypothetical protein